MPLKRVVTELMARGRSLALKIRGEARVIDGSRAPLSRLDPRLLGYWNYARAWLHGELVGTAES